MSVRGAELGWKAGCGVGQFSWLAFESFSDRKDVRGQRKHEGKKKKKRVCLDQHHLWDVGSDETSLPSCMSSCNPFLGLGGTRTNLKRMAITWRGLREQGDLGPGQLPLGVILKVYLSEKP